jgi:hypothetical protein
MKNRASIETLKITVPLCPSRVDPRDGYVICGQSELATWHQRGPFSARLGIAERRGVLVDATGFVDSLQRAEHTHRLVAFRPDANQLRANRAGVSTAHRWKQVMLNVVPEVEREPLEQAR